MTNKHDERVLETLHDLIPHSPLKLEQTHGTEYDKGYIDYQDQMLMRLPEVESDLLTLITTLTKEVREQTLAEVRKGLPSEAIGSPHNDLGMAADAYNEYRDSVLQLLDTLENKK